METAELSSRINVDRVLVSLDIIPADDKKALFDALNFLENFSPEQPLDPRMKKGVVLGRIFYLFDAIPNYQLIFELNDQNEIEVVDLFLKGRLEVFAQALNR